jgi:UDP-N-acetylglucosamine--N-acetylmuramyl-(pentapeptide) pyrophosphoryl-undecaprenol N-acetylglucosamine transferase
LKKKRKKEEKNLQRPEISVIISGGGTGGHIFPAIAIANELKKINPANRILFVGANGRMEMEKVPAAGYTIEGLNISGIQRKLSLSNLALPFKVIGSLLKARKIVRSFKPQVAVGVGGYASGPLLFAASSLKVPSLIQEQNSYAGITNKILSGRVRKICVAYEGMEKYFPKEKIVMTGNPVRQDILEIAGKREEALRFFGLSPDKKVLLVIGGSLGARTINESIREGIDRIAGGGLQLIWQTGKSFISQARTVTENYGLKGIHAFDFIQRMDLAYAAADLVISRAGASSVSELALVAKPAILVPSPNVAEDHQTKNAMALSTRAAAILVTDAAAREQLINEVLNLAGDHPMQETLRKKIATLAIPDSASRIANEIYALAGK